MFFLAESPHHSFFESPHHALTRITQSVPFFITPDKFEVRQREKVVFSMITVDPLHYPAPQGRFISYDKNVPLDLTQRFHFFTTGSSGSCENIETWIRPIGGS